MKRSVDNQKMAQTESNRIQTITIQANDGAHIFQMTDDPELATDQTDVDPPGFNNHIFFVRLSESRLCDVATLGMGTGCGFYWFIQHEYSRANPGERGWDSKYIPHYTLPSNHYEYRLERVGAFIRAGFKVLLVYSADGQCQYQQFRELVQSEFAATVAEQKRASNTAVTGKYKACAIIKQHRAVQRTPHKK